MRDSERSQYLALSRSPYGCWVAAAIDDGDEFVASHTSGGQIVFMGGGLLGSRPEDDRAALAAELGFAEQADLDESHARVAELELKVSEWIDDRDRWFERCKNASADRDKALARVAELEAEVAALKQPVRPRCECKTDPVDVDPVSGPSRPLPNNSTPHNWTWGELITYLEKARRAGRLIGWQIEYSYAFKEPACVLLLSGVLGKLVFCYGDVCEAVKEAVTWLVQHEPEK